MITIITCTYTFFSGVMDEDYGHMFGGEEYLDDDGFDDDIIDYDDGDAGGDDLDLGSEEDAESQM